MKFEEYNSFENGVFDKQHTSLNQFMNPDMRDRTLKIKGLPFNANEDDLATFFKGYDVVGLGFI